MNQLKKWAKQMKQQLTVLYFAAQHPDMPFITKLFALLLVSYAVSPIDLIPDFIPVLGILDDLILLPLGICLCYKMIPAHVLAAAEKEALSGAIEKKHTVMSVTFIIIIWLIALYLVVKFLYQLYS